MDIFNRNEMNKKKKLPHNESFCAAIDHILYEYQTVQAVAFPLDFVIRLTANWRYESANTLADERRILLLFT